MQRVDPTRLAPGVVLYVPCALVGLIPCDFPCALAVVFDTGNFMLQVYSNVLEITRQIELLCPYTCTWSDQDDAPEDKHVVVVRDTVQYQIYPTRI